MNVDIKEGGHRRASGTVSFWSSHGKDILLASRQITAIQQQIVISTHNERTGTCRQIIKLNPAHVQARAASTGTIIRKDNTYLFAHTPACYHTPGEVRNYLQIVLCASRDTIRAECEFFSNTAS